MGARCRRLRGGVPVEYDVGYVTSGLPKLWRAASGFRWPFLFMQIFTGIHERGVTSRL
jgi:hypothetical protein